jgi:hypothetical protein
MTQEHFPDTASSKIALFREYFSGLEHVYGTYNLKTGRAFQVKRKVTDAVILRHLRGEQYYGVYLLDGELTRAVVADFDEADPRDPLCFIEHARQYDISTYLERSKRKGWHVWAFLELPGVPAAKARLVVRQVLRDIKVPSIEIFPKQDRLGETAHYGNFVAAPLFGRMVPRGRTVFVDPKTLRPFPNQWAVLQQAVRVPETLLDGLTDVNDLHMADAARPPASCDVGTKVSRMFGLPPCAQRMLAAGVSEFQRVACFRLALHLKKAGLPEDIALAALRAWALKNRPADGRRIVTDFEIISQTRHAYAKPYRGCGCEEPAVRGFCGEGCPVRVGQTAHHKERV